MLKHDVEAGFAEVYRRYWKMLINTAYKRLNTIEEAEELVQELLISLFDRRNVIQIHGSLEAYLKNALKYKILNLYRSKYTREQYAALILKANNCENVNPEQHLLAKETMQGINSALQKLPEKCKEVFVLSKIELLSNKAIALQLSISVSTVEKHISKGRRLMKDEMGALTNT
jgi:RNA polymerase sigma-70 factor (family 1)